MKRFYLLVLLFPFQVVAQALQVNNLKCEYKADPMGIEAVLPKLSWELQSAAHNVMQISYSTHESKHTFESRENLNIG